MYNFDIIYPMSASYLSILPRPKAGALAALLLSAAGLCFGMVQNEVVLLLCAFMLAVPLVWSFIALVFLAVLHKRRRFHAAAPELKVTGAGSKLFFYLNEQNRPSKFRLPPAIIIRYRLLLTTKDNRRIWRVFGPELWKHGKALCEIKRRGAYFGEMDEVVFSDVFGFFEHRKPVEAGAEARLLVQPEFKTLFNFSPAFSGGSRRRTEQRVIKTDDLIEQRPYVPGDDPRRINWKLLSHAGGLFVREEEREPPPHTRFVLLICAEAAGGLYKAADEAPGAAETDLLCEAAFVIMEDALQNGVEVFFGSCGTEMRAINTGNIAEALALPWASAPAAPPLPAPAHGEKELSIFALPLFFSNKRVKSNNALEDFIKARPPGLRINLFFIWKDERFIGSAEASVLHYSGMEGIYAKSIKL